MTEHRIVVERRSGKRMSPDLVRQQIQHCADLAMKGGRGRGWSYKITRIDEPFKQPSGDVLHKVTVVFAPTSARESLDEKWPSIVKRFAEALCAGNLRAQPWRVLEPVGYAKIAEEAKVEQSKAEQRKVLADEPKVLGEVNLEPGDHFSRIYGREAQIRRTLDSLKLAQRTDWKKRRNTLFDGPAGCGKTESMLALAAMLGEEGKAWRWFDATAMTKAGAIEEIMESKIVPPVIFIEEIEKTDEQSLRWLLGIMDTRGEIRRTNYRVGNQARNVRMVVIASANNVKLLKSMMAGALYSRFQNRIYFPEPDRKIMSKILEREILEIKGNVAWIEPTLAFGYDKWGMRDPRDMINILSCGGDRLLTKDYQQDYESTMHPFDRRELLRKKKKQDAIAAKLV